MFIKKGQSIYILAIGESPNLRGFLKSRNLKKFAMSPNTHSTPTLVLLVAVLQARARGGGGPGGPDSCRFSIQSRLCPQILKPI